MQDIETSQKLLKPQHKEEFRELGEAVQDIEISQDLLSQKYGDHKDKLQQLKISNLKKTFVTTRNKQIS